MEKNVDELTKNIDKQIKELEDNEIDTVDKLTDYIDKKIKKIEEGE